MDLSGEEKRISDIFKDLQKDRQENGIIINLIDRSRTLIPDKKTDNFHGDKLKNKITYNPDYFHDVISKYDDNLIRFILLHEEAHVSDSKNRLKEFFYIFIGIVTSLTIIIAIFTGSVRLIFQESQYEIPGMVFALFFLFICLLTGIPAIWRYQWDAMFEDELSADHYGVMCLLKYFNDVDIVTTVSPFFTEEPSIQEKERIARKIRNMKLCGVYPDYHPSNPERLEKIRQASISIGIND